MILVTLFNVLYYLFFSFNKEIKTTSIIIEQGMKLDEISEMCYTKKKIIDNEFAFKTWIKLNFLEKKIKFGEFEISGKNSIFNITRKLSSAKFVFRKFTLVEGMYKYDLLKFLKKVDPTSNLNISDIPDNLIADTYSFVVTDSANRILENIIDHSQKFSRVFGRKGTKIFH